MPQWHYSIVFFGYQTCPMSDVFQWEGSQTHLPEQIKHEAADLSGCQSTDCFDIFLNQYKRIWLLERWLANGLWWDVLCFCVVLSEKKKNMYICGLFVIKPWQIFSTEWNQPFALVTNTADLCVPRQWMWIVCAETITTVHVARNTHQKNHWN